MKVHRLSQQAIRLEMLLATEVLMKASVVGPLSSVTTFLKPLSARLPVQPEGALAWAVLMLSVWLKAAMHDDIAGFSSTIPIKRWCGISLPSPWTLVAD